MIHYKYMNINEFVAKKIGEAIAFCIVGTDTLEKGGEALALQLGDETVLDIREKNTLYREALEKIATEGGMASVTEAKVAKTVEKLTAMREMYIGDQWDNPTEIFEWSGFFYGASIVHFAVVRGAAEALEHDGLLELTNEGINFQYEILEKIESKLSEVGTDRAF